MPQNDGANIRCFDGFSKYFDKNLNISSKKWFDAKKELYYNSIAYKKDREHVTSQPKRLITQDNVTTYSFCFDNITPTVVYSS